MREREISVRACLNWTKVGLKGNVTLRIQAFSESLNWTKVGLKDTTNGTGSGECPEFELD